MKKGKEPMRTFGDLMQFFETKTDDKKPPVEGKKEPDKKEHEKTLAAAAGDAPVAEAATEPASAGPLNGPAVPATETAVPAARNVVEANLESPPPPPAPAESVSTQDEPPAAEPQTPPADEGRQ